MPDETATAPPAAPASPKETAPVTAEIAKATEAATEAEASTTEAAAPPADKEEASEKPAEAAADAEAAPEKAAEPADAEMKDAEPAPAAADGGEEAQSEGEEAAAGSAADESAAASSKSKDKSRRKSTGGGANKKSLKKKGSMARILHLDAKPGDFYMIKTKGYSAWPGVVADEEMLPQAIIAKRPVTAMRPDGTYREDVADGGKRVQDRTFPVMYLETNEFAWIRNTDLHDIDFDTVAEKIPSKANKQLQAAHKIVAEKHPLSYFKDILANHQEATLQELQAIKEAEEAEKAEKAEKAAKEAAKAQATPAKKSHKKKVKTDEDEDLEMPDADEEEGSDTVKKSSKKRKADESAETPQRTDSVKKPKIKITSSSTPKVTNGSASTPKASKSKDESKSAKPRSHKKKEVPEESATEIPKEPELSPEEKHARKEKEVLFLRHKLQRGLLTKDQSPKEDEVEIMSNYLTKLEVFKDLEVSIIRATKINKVLKAILKLENIPREDEFDFKGRSQVLLDQWTKLLSVDEKPAGEGANGINGSSAEASKNTPEPSKAKTNGVKPASEEAPEAAKEPEKKASEEAADKSEEKAEEKAEEKPDGEESKAAEPVAGSA